MNRKIIFRIISVIIFAAVLLLAGCNSEKDKRYASLSFHSYDGGAEYSIVVKDTSIVSCTTGKEYSKANHEELNGAGYNITFTFTGKKEGKTTATVTENMPFKDNSNNIVYELKVDKKLKVTIEKIG